MNFGISRRHGRSSIHLAQLFCSASVVAMAAGSTAWAQQVAQQEDIPETVLITGSLITGAVSVGVPVNSLRTLDFVETGQLSLTDVLRSVPSLDIDAQASPTYGGGTLSFLQNVQIHSLGTGSGVETLLLVNGMRFPPQNYSNDSVNPSIIPQIAIERVDVLTAGASAVYGSDATAGVINIILRRGFDGAMTQVGVSSSPQIGYLHTSFAQLFGRTWDTGNITVSYTRTDSPVLQRRSATTTRRISRRGVFGTPGREERASRAPSMSATLFRTIGQTPAVLDRPPGSPMLPEPTTVLPARNPQVVLLQYYVRIGRSATPFQGARRRRPHLGRYRNQHRWRSDPSEYRQQLASRRRETRDSVEPVSRDLGSAADAQPVRRPRDRCHSSPRASIRTRTASRSIPRGTVRPGKCCTRTSKSRLSIRTIRSVGLRT